MARDKNKDELQTHQRDLELRQQAQDYKEEINLPEEEVRGMDTGTDNDEENKEK